VKVAVIFLGGSSTQNICFWPSYKRCVSGYYHHFVFIHRNWIGVDVSCLGIPDHIYIENKIDKNGNDVPHGAFGGYRKYFHKYKKDYDLFVFISDDVVLRRGGWLKVIVDILGSNDKLGFGASQMFHAQPPNYPSHIRAPFWFAKTEALDKINWEFNSDHDGEIKIADQLTSAGYFGVQVGNKLDLGYDSLDADSTHITCELEKKFFPEKKFIEKFDEKEFDIFRKILKDGDLSNTIVKSRLPHISDQNYIIDLEPFDRLVYRPSLDIVKKYDSNYVKNIYKDIYVYERYIN